MSVKLQSIAFSTVSLYSYKSVCQCFPAEFFPVSPPPPAPLTPSGRAAVSPSQGDESSALRRHLTAVPAEAPAAAAALCWGSDPWEQRRQGWRQRRLVWPPWWHNRAQTAESAYSAGEPGLIPGWETSPGEGDGSPLQYSTFCGQRSLEGYSPWGHKDSDTTKRLTLSLLVVQWTEIRLPMQGTRVRPLVWEDCMCRGAGKGCALEPVLRSKTPQWAAHAPQLEKARTQRPRPSTTNECLKDKTSHAFTCKGSILTKLKQSFLRAHFNISVRGEKKT